MVKLYTSAALFSAVWLAANVALVNCAVVETKLGQVDGALETSRDGREYLAWRGIPYAQPPVGDLRYQSPKPALKWSGVRNASVNGPECAQLSFLTRQPSGEEDCLHLNIYTPKAKFEEALNNTALPAPVMVWIHGGGFVLGSGNEYGPGYLMDEDVVLVTINYRLGSLGFLSTQDENIRGNMGLKDQSLALHWVKDNIEAFGGDPKSITIFGESAGGSSVHFQMLSQKNKGVFQRAISQSGTALSAWANYPDPVGQAKTFASDVGCPTENMKELADCLKTADLNKTLWAHSPLSLSKFVFTPVAETINDEEAFLTKRPEQVYADGEALEVPWLAGVTSNEGLFFMANFASNDTNIERAKEDFHVIEKALFLFQKHDPERSSKIRNFYLGNDQDPVNVNTTETRLAIQDAASDWTFNVPNHDAIQLHAQTAAPVYPYLYGQRGPSGLLTFELLFGKYPPGQVPKEELQKLFTKYFLRMPDDPDLGVAHGDELFLMFQMGEHVKVEKDSPWYDFSKRFVHSWVQFAKGGQPELGGVRFPEVKSKDDIKYMFIDDKPKVMRYPYIYRYNFWKSLNLKY